MCPLMYATKISFGGKNTIYVGNATIKLVKLYLLVKVADRHTLEIITVEYFVLQGTRLMVKL